MPSTNLGKVSVTPKGAWSNSTAYEILDIVSNDGSSYIALKSVPAGTALSNTSYWLMIASKGDKGDTGEINGASASISGGYGTPSVSVTEGGTSTDRSYAFAFSNLKGNGIASIEIEETATVGNVHTYTLTATLDSGETETCTFDVTDGAVTSVNGRTGAVTGLAEQDGYYDDMTVGGAEQLISSTYVTDSVPYVFRTSGGSADIGDREFDEIHGGTIAWNQLLNGTMSALTHNGIRIEGTDGTFTFSGTATNSFSAHAINNMALISNHVYLLYGTQSGISADNESIRISSFDVGNTSDTVFRLNVVNKAVNAGGVVQLRLANMTIGHEYNVTSKLCFVDLTQMFGSAIADYIYSLEQSNTGSGVAWFKSLFNKPYYAFNSGELISVSGLSAHKMTGFNQLNEEVAFSALGGITKTSNGWSGASYLWPSTQTGTARAGWSNITFLPNMSYCVTAHLSVSGSTTNGRVRVFYTDGTSDNGNAIAQGSSGVSTIVSDGSKSVKEVGITYGSNADGTIVVAWMNVGFAWDGERDGEYEPYVVHEYTLDPDVTLRGIPKLDADNKLYYDGDIYQSDGTVQRRYGIVTFDGSSDETWNRQTLSGGEYVFYVPLNTLVHIEPTTASTYIGKMICDKLATVKKHTLLADDFGITGYWDWNASYPNQNWIYIRPNDTVTDVTGIKAWLQANPITVVYELATPTTESAEPYTNPQIVDDWGTGEYVIAEQSGVKMPVGHETKYTANLKAKLEMAPNSPSGNGDYIVRQTNGINEYVPLTERIPNAPSENGNYILKCTVSGSTVTYVWEAQA